MRIKGTDGNGLKTGKNKIGARGIFTYFNINPKGSFPAEIDSKENAIIVDLKKIKV